MRILQTILILFISSILTAQIYLPKDTFVHKVNFSVLNGPNKKLYLEYDKKELPDIINSFDFNIEDADLKLQSTLKRLKGKYNYSTNISIETLHQNALKTSRLNLSNSSITIKHKNIDNEIIWKNITEAQIYPNNQYILTYYVIKNEILGFDCNNPPSFKFKEKWPYFTAIAMGSGLIISSRIIRANAIKERKEAEQTRINYTQGWQAGKTQEQTGHFYSENTQAYDDAIRKNNKQAGLFLAGSSIILAGVAGYYLHRQIYKKNKQLFEDNKHRCEQVTSYLQIDPIIILTDNNYNQQIGLNLTYTF